MDGLSFIGDDSARVVLATPPIKPEDSDFLTRATVSGSWGPQVQELLERYPNSPWVTLCCGVLLNRAGKTQESFRLLHQNWTKILSMLMSAGARLDPAAKENEPFFLISKRIIGQTQGALDAATKCHRLGLAEQILQAADCMLTVEPSDTHGFRHAITWALLSTGQPYEAHKRIHTQLLRLPRAEQFLSPEDTLNYGLTLALKDGGSKWVHKFLVTALPYVAFLLLPILTPDTRKKAAKAPSGSDLERALSYRDEFGALWASAPEMLAYLRPFVSSMAGMVRSMPKGGGFPPRVLAAAARKNPSAGRCFFFVRLSQVEAMILGWRNDALRSGIRLNFDALLLRVRQLNCFLHGCAVLDDVNTTMSSALTEIDLDLKAPIYRMYEEQVGAFCFEMPESHVFAFMEDNAGI